MLMGKHIVMGWFTHSRGEAKSPVSDEQNARLVRTLNDMATDPAHLDAEVISLAADSDDPHLRILAIRTALATCYAKSMQLCLKLLFDEDDHVIQEAIRALETVGDPSALPHLRRLTYSEDPDIALSAIDAMRALQNSTVQQQVAA